LIIKFLTGDHLDRETLGDAVRVLQRDAPDVLEHLVGALGATRLKGSPDEEHDWESLQDYLDLGPDGPTQMPEVHLHVLLCDECAATLEMLREGAALSVEWRADLEPVAAAAVSSTEWRDDVEDDEGGVAMALALGERGWKWVARSRAASATVLGSLGDADARLGRRVGEWVLRQLAPSELGFAFPDDTKPLVALLTTLHDGAAKIGLAVVPVFVATTHQWEWRLRLELVAPARLARVDVGIGTQERRTSGTHTLTVTRPVEVAVAQPMRAAYWLHFEWRMLDGSFHTQAIELPLTYDPELDA
jgi:hypothetical protein